MKTKLRKLAVTLLASAAALLLLLAVACAESGGSFSLDRSSVEVEAGQTVTLTPVFEDFGDDAPDASDVTWRSSAPAVAQVVGGTVYGVSEGTATVTASLTHGGKDYSADCAVTVTSPDVETGYEVTLTLDERELTLEEGEGHTLLPTVSVLLNGEPQTAPEVQWRSENAQVATVSGGRVTATGVGNTTIVASVTVGGKEYSAECAVTVNAVPQAYITLSVGSKELNAGTSFTLTASVTDRDGDPVEGAQVEWSTSDAAVATVSSSGEVRGVEGGYAVITATAEGVSATCDLTVLNHYEVLTFASRADVFGKAYELADGTVSQAAFLQNFNISVERNGVALTDLTQYTELQFAAEGSSVSVTDTGLRFVQTGESTVTVRLVERTDGSEIASAVLPVTVCDEILEDEADYLAIDGTKYYALAADLDFSDGYELGAADTGVTLTGTLNGMGHSITAAFATGEDNNCGLFRMLDGGTVKNLSVIATFGTLNGGVGGWMYRYGPLAASAQGNAVVENCFVRTTYTVAEAPSANHGITGLVGYADNFISVYDTIVAVSAPADASYVFGLNHNSCWNGWYTLRNVLVYTSGENITLLGTNGELQPSENYQAFTGGLNGPAAEAAREALLAKAKEIGLSDFVQAQFTAADLLPDKASIAFTNASETLTERGTLTFPFTATNLITNTPITAENIEWATDTPSVATVNNGVVTGVSAGTAVITATVIVGGKSYSATVSVTVEELITASISFDADNPAQVGEGSQITLSVTAKNLLDDEDIDAYDITWESKDKSKATVENGVVTGKAKGDVVITASVTVEGKTYTAEWTVTVGSFSIEIAFAQERYDLDAGGTVTEVFAMDVTATLNDEPWSDWAQYTTFSSGNAEILKIEGSTVTVLGTGSTTVTANFSYAGISRTATADVELWTQLIDSEDEFLALGAYKNGAIADWSGRYLITKDLDFAGKTVTQLGNVTGTIDGGGHALKNIKLAALGKDGQYTGSDTGEGDDRFLFYNVSGTITNITLTVTLGFDKAEQGSLGTNTTIMKYSAGLCYWLEGTFSDSTLNVRFLSHSSQPYDAATENDRRGAVCVYAGWQSETVGCTVNVGWMFTDWGTNGEYTYPNQRVFGYCYHAWGTNQAKLTDTALCSTEWIEYAGNQDNIVKDGVTITQDAASYMSKEDFAALFA